MQVSGLFRYPVKSMQGEPLAELEFDGAGVAGDRRLGVRDEASGTVLSAKREARLLLASARTSEGGVEVELPGFDPLGAGPALDDALTDFLGRPVSLVAAGPEPASYQSPSDFADDGSPLETWRGVPGTFVDSSPVYLLGAVELSRVAAARPELEWDPRRFRPNVVVAGASDSAMLAELTTGRRIRLGTALLEVLKPCERCVMTTRPQPGGLTRQLEVLRHLHAVAANTFGTLAAVVAPGAVRLGDDVSFEH